MDSRILTINDLREIVSAVGVNKLMDEMIAQLTESLNGFDESIYTIPLREGFEYTQPNVGLLEWMPAMRSGQTAMIKLVGYHPANPERNGLPTILSTVAIYDTATGHLISLADGTFLTALRTGAASAVASNLLASPQSRVLGLIGCGAQALTQLHALTRVFDFAEVLVYDVDRDISNSFLERAAFLNQNIQVCEPGQIVAQADILCTQTSVAIGKGPVFQDSGNKSHLHINAVGSDFPGKVEVPLSLLKRSLVCPDFPGQAVLEGESQQLQPEEIGPSFVELVNNFDLYEDARQRTSVFDSTGWALEDLIGMEMLLNYAEELGIGRLVQMECVSEDPHNPYYFVLESQRHHGKKKRQPAGNKVI